MSETGQQQNAVCPCLTPDGMMLCHRLGLTFPLFLAGMGGVAGPALAAAVSDAGGGGTLGLYRCPPEQLAALLTDTRSRTDRPFGVNFVPEVVSVEQLQQQVEAVVRWAQAASEPLPFFTFFGLPPASVTHWLAQQGASLLIQVGSREEAVQAAALKPCALILQGTEAGGHLLGVQPVLALLAAVRPLQSSESLPLLVAGAVGAPEALVGLEQAGACGAVCGTLFVATQESDAHEHYKARVMAARAQDTVITDVFETGWPGRRHRVLTPAPSLLTRTLPPHFIATTHIYGRQHPIPRYAAAVPLRQTIGKVEEMAHYCGMSCESIEPVNTALPSATTTVRRFRMTYERLKVESPAR